MTQKKQRTRTLHRVPRATSPASIESLNKTILDLFLRIGLACERPEDHLPIEIALRRAFVIGEIDTSLDNGTTIRIGTSATKKTTFVFAEDGTCTRDNPSIRYSSWISGIRAILVLLDRLLKGIVTTASSARHQANNGRWRFGKAA